MVVEVAFEVVIAEELTVAAGALEVVALATELEPAPAAGVEAPDAAVVLAEVARVVPEAAARVLEETEELELEMALPDDAVFQ